eukprot:COSAG06_NODE_1592_length_8988_cov_197.895264_6_plen_297_part_00
MIILPRLARDRQRENSENATVFSQHYPAVDGIASVYNYLPVTRNFTGPTVPVGLMDAMAAAGKLLVMEDDTRTRICDVEKGCPRSGQPLHIVTTKDSVNAVTRNMLTTGLHGAAQYFGMNGGAWYGSTNATMPSDGGDPLTETTRALWGNISLVGEVLRRGATAATAAVQHHLAPQVAIFVDPDAALVPLFGGDLICSYQDLHYMFAQWGTPVRFYFLRQLPSLDEQELANVRLAIMHGTSVMSTAVSDAVREKLQRDNRTLIWTGAAALLKSTEDDEFTRHDTVRKHVLCSIILY